MIVTVLSNLRLSLSLGGGYSVLAFTFSGLTFLIMAMSKPMQWFCCIFPFTFYTDIMVDQALRGASGDIFVARHGHHRPVHHSSAAMPAASAYHLHE